MLKEPKSVIKRILHEFAGVSLSKKLQRAEVEWGQPFGVRLVDAVKPSLIEDL